jgi:hypothetical protein
MIEIATKDDPFKREVWQFGVFEESGTDRVVIRLNYYCVQKRPTMRHKWRSLIFYRRIDDRNNTIKKDDVPLPDWVKNEARSKLEIIVKI